MSMKAKPLALLLASAILLSCNFARSLVPGLAIPTGTAVLVTYTPAPTQSSTALPDECMKFDLTPEECANTGTHEYSTTSQVLFDVSGQTCEIEDSDNRNLTVSITFSDRNTFSYVDSFEMEEEFVRKSDNVYQGEYIQPDGDFKWEETLTFTETGFTIEAKSYNLKENEHLCTFLWEQKIVGVRDQPTSTPVAAATLPPQDLSIAGEEIVEFMVDYIVANEIEAMIDIIDQEDIPMIEEPPARFIIVLSPVSQPVESDYSNLSDALDTANAEQVWIYEDGDLSTPADKQKAIEEYREFMRKAPDFPSIFMWGYNEFGILSISEDGQEAEVYLSASCGSLCGHGVVLVLVRNSDSEWEIKETKPLWVS